MNRRDALKAGVAGLATLGAAVAAQSAARAAGPTRAAASATDAILRASLECQRTGDVCLDHCLKELAKGDRSLAECASSVKQMVAVCRSLGPVATSGSSHFKALLRVCRDICEDCRKVCDRHAHHHAECRACRDACAAFVAEARKLV